MVFPIERFHRALFQLMFKPTEEPNRINSNSKKQPQFQADIKGQLLMQRFLFQPAMINYKNQQ
jgi:hypothetical protein